jgi:hypothetical protein
MRANFAKNKILIILLAAALFLSLAVLVLVLMAKNRVPKYPPLPLPPIASQRITTSPTEKPKSGSLYFSKQFISALRGKNFTIAVNLSASGEVTGADAVINFDSRLLQFVKAEPTKLFNQYPRAKLDKKNNRVIITGVQTKNPLLSPNGELVRLTFTALSTGSAKLNLDINRSTIVEAQTAKNILGNINNAIVTVE